METIIIQSDNKKEIELIKQVMKKMNIEARSLTNDEMEDIGMGVLIREADRSKTVLEETIRY